MNLRSSIGSLSSSTGRHLVRRRFASTVSAGLLKELENRGFVAATTRSVAAYTDGKALGIDTDGSNSQSWTRETARSQLDWSLRRLRPVRKLAPCGQPPPSTLLTAFQAGGTSCSGTSEDELQPRGQTPHRSS